MGISALKSISTLGRILVKLQLTGKSHLTFEFYQVFLFTFSSHNDMTAAWCSTMEVSCHVTPEGSTNDDSRSLGIKINLQVKPQISVLKNESGSWITTTRFGKNGLSFK